MMLTNGMIKYLNRIIYEIKINYNLLIDFLVN